MPKGAFFQVARRPDDHRHDPGLARGLPLQRPLHLPAPDEVRGDEVVAHQEEDQVRPLELLLDPFLPPVAGEELAVGPGVDQALALEELERLLEADPVPVVGVRVAEEDPDR